MSNQENGSNAADTKSGPPSEVQFHLIKSNCFRVIYADGVLGGMAPNLNLQMSLYNTRAALPQLMINTVNPDGTLGEERVKERVGRDGFVREVEAEVIMDLDFAQALHKWLGEKIEIMQKALQDNQQAKLSERT
jgi:hypothetical protein